MLYALLIHSDLPANQQLTDEERREAIRAHQVVQKEASAKGQFVAAAQLDRLQTAVTLRNAESGFSLHDGPFMETKEWLVGFYLLECPDQETALAHARRLCPIGTGSIELRPVVYHRAV